MRAYGSEPILFSTSPITPSHEVSKKPQKRRMLVVGIVIAMSAVIVGCSLWFLSRGDSSRLPEKFFSLPFQLYEPDWLPPGMSIDSDSFGASSQALTFSIRDATGQQLVVTEQPKPSQKEIEEFYAGQLLESSTFTTPAGQGTIGSFEGSALTGILTNETWILIRSVSNVDASQLKQIAMHFRSVP